MRHAEIMSHLMSNGGGEADQVLIVVLKDKCTTFASNPSEYIVKYQHSHMFPVVLGVIDHTNPMRIPD